MSSMPAYNPPTPFMGIIPGSFRPSLMIRVKGSIHEHNGRCVIDFIPSPSNYVVNETIIFHLSIRPNENAIVRNHFKDHCWGVEERYGQFSIRRHETFEIFILADYEFYKIAVNGHHIGVFRHRLPLHLVNFVRVSGQVKIDHVLLEQDIQTSNQGQIVVTQTNHNATPYNPNGSGIAGISSTVHAVPAVPPYTPMNVYVMNEAHPPPHYQAPGSSSSKIANIFGIAIERNQGQIVIKKEKENKNILKF